MVEIIHILQNGRHSTCFAEMTDMVHILQNGRHDIYFAEWQA